jgi:NAD(P)-dependent dehydrogenase (short-subunit alcohol dehydrogenase family)
MTMRVANKIALVTGGAGGIGSAAARLLAAEGATVFVGDLAEESGEAIAREIGGTFLRLDVSALASWESAVGAIIARHGRIDVLAHCAGIEGNYIQAGISTSVDEWNRVIGVNLTGSFFGCRTVYPHMLDQGSGSVILVASCVSAMATSSGVAYGASKAGMTQLARSFAAIGWKDGKRVRCNSVHPGPIRTRMTDNIFAELAVAANISVGELETAIKQVIPMGDRGEPDDIGYMILYLASDESRYASGAEFFVDGGWTVVDAG